MNATLTFLKYKNYYDRRLDFSNIWGSVADYTSKFESKGMGPRVLDFDFGDGMTTKQFVKGFESDDGFFAYNYLLVDTGGEGLVSSRWYVTEAKYVRGGGYWVSLRRDVLADYFNTVRKSTVLVTKGMLKDSSPLVFNREGVSYNQIKKLEIPLPDDSNVSWVVGYIPRDFAKDADKTIEVDYTTLNPDFTYETQADMQAEEWYQYLNVKQYSMTNIRIGYRTVINDVPTNLKGQYEHFKDTGWDVDYDPQDIPGGLKWYKANDGRTYTSPNQTLSSIKSANSEFPVLKVAVAIKDAFTPAYNWLHDSFPQDGYESAAAVMNKVIYVKETDKYYMVSYEESEAYVDTDATTVGGDFNAKMKAGIESVEIKKLPGEVMEHKYMQYSSSDAFVTRKQRTILITLTELNLKVTVTIPKNRQHLLDTSLYDMFAMPVSLEKPYGSILYSGSTVSQDGYMSLAVASKVTAEAGSGAVYDVQWLPYCPVRENLKKVLGATFFDASRDNCVPIKDKTNNVVGFMAFASRSNFHFKVRHAIPAVGRMETRKESNELETWRLCSPNYNGIFEFSPAKNDGVKNFHVDCTYKPFQPYIRVSPVFKGLYGGDYEDKRGLILGGDFSLPRLTTEWANYVQNNKNYQASFDRQIESMDLRHKIGMTEAVMGSIAGIIQGGAHGAQAGASIGGGPIGAIVGGAVGTAAAVAGGIADVMNTKALYNDEIDRTKKLFQYSLQNIQAIPSSISKASGFDLNVKPFPFIEYYCPTQTEIDAFRNMIKWNGMTVGVVGTMEDYFPESLDDLGTTYFEASVIRLYDFDGDFHEADAIAYELRRGIYI